MKISENTIHFKSDPENYTDECSDLKNNTLRRVSKPERMHIDKWAELQTKYIEITNSITGESFKREVRNVKPYQNWIVITWWESSTFLEEAVIERVV